MSSGWAVKPLTKEAAGRDEEDATPAVGPAKLLDHQGARLLPEAPFHDSFMSRANTLVCPGGKMDVAMQLTGSKTCTGQHPRRETRLCS